MTTTSLQVRYGARVPFPIARVSVFETPGPLEAAGNGNFAGTASVNPWGDVTDRFGSRTALSETGEWEPEADGIAAAARQYMMSPSGVARSVGGAGSTVSSPARVVTAMYGGSVQHVSDRRRPRTGNVRGGAGVVWMGGPAPAHTPGDGKGRGSGRGPPLPAVPPSWEELSQELLGGNTPGNAQARFDGAVGPGAGIQGPGGARLGHVGDGAGVQHGYQPQHVTPAASAALPGAGPATDGGGASSGDSGAASDGSAVAPGGDEPSLPRPPPVRTVVTMPPGYQEPPTPPASPVTPASAIVSPVRGWRQAPPAAAARGTVGTRKPGVPASRRVPRRKPRGAAGAGRATSAAAG